VPAPRRAELSTALVAAAAAGVIPPISEHALRQAVARGVTPHLIVVAIRRGIRFTQKDGANVYVYRLHGRGHFYAIVGGNGLVTVSRKDLTAHEIRRATIRYEWAMR
jgi:hypothetical protein